MALDDQLTVSDTCTPAVHDPCLLSELNHAYLPSLCLQSDSANLDNVTELLVQSGTPVETALMALVPEAYRNHPDLMKDYPEVT